MATQEGRPALVFEDFGGLPLTMQGRLEPLEFLRVAERIAAAVEEVHRVNVIHKDLKPDNILVDPTTGAVKLMGFGFATRTPCDDAESRQVIEGSLPYMSPEQTGRMNRAVDSRSDLYSLGVVFFEMLTERLPFEANDALGWVYCHVARTPPSPKSVVDSLPQPIADIVLKCLSKRAEDRYQTAHGLAADLAHCRVELEEHGRLEPFALATRDVPDRLQLSQTLYGRQADVAVLERAFHRVLENSHPELVLVTGHPGVGKSVLVHELVRVVAEDNGSFLTGKFEQYQQGIPNLAIAEAFRAPVREILGADEVTLTSWRQSLSDSLGPDARLVADLVPELELVLGPLPAVPSLGLIEDEQRFQRAFARFVAAFARGGRPLVLFLDDLQWSDQATMRLLEHILTDVGEVPMVVIGAYRDSEVSAGHPLDLALEKIRKTGRLVEHVRVEPLSLGHITGLVADTVRRPRADVRSLAELLFAKTGGNPFFALQFLHELVAQRMLHFDDAAYQWRWDAQQIRRAGYTDNIVDLLVGRIKQLPSRTLRLLELAAITGSFVTEGALATISQRREASVRRDLVAAVRAGLLVRAGTKYRFAHDRVQQAVHTLIPEAELPAYHARVGRLLLDSTPEASLSEHIFDIAGKLNVGRDVLSAKERDRLAELNLVAGRKAKAATAYDAATHYFATGASLLPSDDPDHPQAAVSFELGLELASCELLTGQFEASKTRLTLLEARARTKRQLADVARLEITNHLAVSDHTACIDIALRCLRRFGIEWRAQPSWDDVRAERERLDQLLNARTIEELEALPPMVDPDALAVMDLFAAMKAPALITSPTLTCVLGYRMVATSVAFGNGPTSGFGYATLSMALWQYLDAWEEAYRYGKLGQQVGERLTPPSERGKIYLDFSLMCAWCRPMADSYRIFEHELELTRRWGDFPFASYMQFHYVGYLLLGGVPLVEVRRMADDGTRYTRETKFWFVEQMFLIEERFVACLEGKTTEFGSLDGDGFDETAFQSMLDGNEALQIVLNWFSTWQLVARYMAGRYEDAIPVAPAALANSSMPLSVAVIFARVYHALTRAALVDRASSEEERRAHLAGLHEELGILRTWAERCPDNYGHHYALVAAEAARVDGNHLEAEALYERAISSARERDSVYVASVALAMELAGRYYLSRGFARIGDVYIADARDCYQRWGATGKVTQLERVYPRIAREGEATRGLTVTARHEQLDLLSVTKASQCIAEETELEDLIRTLMRVVLEQSLGRRGYLVLSQNGDPRIRAEARCTEAGIEATIFSTPVVGSTLLPEPLVNYVWRTREQVVLAEASEAAKTARLIPGEYVQRFGPKSVLCRPIVRRGELVGVLYLENDLVTHAFTPTRVGALEVIAAQAAISLEIAIALQEERRSRAALVASEARFRRVSESNMIGIMFVDLSGRILDANDYVLNLLGYSRNAIEAGTLRWDEITPLEYAPLDAGNVLALREGRALAPFEKEYFRKDGSRVAVLLGAAPLEEGSEEVVTFLLDVTERRRLFVQEQEARAEAERALRMREEFMAIAAHELRTPLTPLKLQLQMLQQQLGDESEGGAPKARKNLVKMFTTADRQVDRLRRLVDDMLDLSKFGKGSPALEREQVNLAELVTDVVERYRPEAARANSTVVLHAPHPVRGYWDRQRIEQVVVNLLTNAIKYGASNPIEVIVREHGDRVRMTIRDRGIGIREEDHARIFGRFERAVSVKHFGGFGLGLYIGMEIAKAHGGTIRVESRLGEGAAFTLELPLPPRDHDSVEASCGGDESLVVE